MGRIEGKFRQLQDEGKKAFIVYLTCGYPDLKTTHNLILEMEKIGVDIIELGVPFSDPLADGPTIQKSSQAALEKGISLKDVLALSAQLRKEIDIPLVLMGYYNPILRYGIKNFVGQAMQIGIDGLIVPDLPPDEASPLQNEIKEKRQILFSARPVKRGKEGVLDLIFLLAPTSTEERIKLVCQHSEGFIYYVSLAGVTGARDTVPAGIRESISKIKKWTDKPVCIGFGVSHPGQIKIMRQITDGIIVGSAIINVMEKNKGKNLIKKTLEFTRKLLQATRQ